MAVGIQDEDSEDSGIRGILRKYPAVILGGIAVLVLVALWYSMGSMAKQGQGAFFTVDDGATFFADDFREAPPFMSGGKEAVQAVVISCDQGKTKKVGWLVRYVGDNKKRADAIIKSGNIGMMPDAEVKAPGTGEWVSSGNVAGVANMKEFEKAQAAAKKANEIVNPKCPDGKGFMIMLPE
jgi:hypothetical protein